ncbi:hypothetical protein Q3G72_010954 [Acer saccharum]|nr:hypothetical protein Q3G72_010954 [Acer saccharum]
MLPLRMLVMIFCRKLLAYSKLLVQKNTAEAPLASAKTEEVTAEVSTQPLVELQFRKWPMWLLEGTCPTPAVFHPTRGPFRSVLAASIGTGPYRVIDMALAITCVVGDACCTCMSLLHIAADKRVEARG